MRGLSVTVVNLYDSYSHDAPSSWQVHSNLSYLTKAFWAFIFTLRNNFYLKVLSLPAFGKLTVSSFYAPFSLWSQYFVDPMGKAECLHHSKVNRWIKDWILPTMSSPQCSWIGLMETAFLITLLCTPCSYAEDTLYSLLAGWTYSLLNCGSLTDGNDSCFQDVHIYIKSLTKFSRSSKNLDPCFCS